MFVFVFIEKFSVLIFFLFLFVFSTVFEDFSRIRFLDLFRLSDIKTILKRLLSGSKIWIYFSEAFYLFILMERYFFALRCF